MGSVLTLPGSPQTIEFGFKQAREFIVEEAFGKPTLSQFHTIDTEIKAKEQLAFLNRLPKVSIKDPGCGTGISDAVLGTSEKFWDPEPVKFWIQQCEADLRSSLLTWANGNGIDRPDLTKNSLWQSFIMDLMVDAKWEDVLRMAWLSDTSIQASDLTAGASDVKFYDIYDGFWKQMIDSINVGGDDDAVRVGSGSPPGSDLIPENTAATVALQLDLQSTDAKKIRAKNVFQALYRDSDSRLTSNPNAIIIATKTLCDNYAEFLESQGNDNSFDRIEGGFKSLKYRGTEIWCFDLLDRYLNSDFKTLTGSPAALTIDTPHRAVLTTKQNLRIGLDSTNSTQKVRIYFDETTEQWNGKILSVEDVKMLWGYMCGVAF